MSEIPNPVPLYPFDPQRLIGSVYKVTPSAIDINLPSAAEASARLHFGDRIGGGEVGELIFVACEEYALFGRIAEVKLPERERLSVNEEPNIQKRLNPLGTAQLLATISLDTGQVTQGITRCPRLGSGVYSAHPLLVRWMVAQCSRQQKDALTLPVGTLPDAGNIALEMKPEQLFGRHCAVLGATGGGKSWTIARMLEQCAKFRSKVILLDATGEFHRIGGPSVRHLVIGNEHDRRADSEKVAFPYKELTESDLFAIFTPSGQSQAPKLREAIKSLKVAAREPTLAPHGVIEKANKPKEPFEAAYRRHVAAVESPVADFDISHLCDQIGHECVYPTGGRATAPDPSVWGNPSNEAAYCVGLQMRVQNFVQSPHLACLFQPGALPSVSGRIREFVADPTARVLRIALQNISFEASAREILTNAIGRCLLVLAREGAFRDCPLIVFLDEGHQFLDKTLGDENTRLRLDAFGLIAKEGRKYGLTACIATQRPRDVPDDVFSQIGTLIVHRLTNDRDRTAVERACGEMDRSVSAFLPTLGPGEAIVVGVDFPIPLVIKVDKPDNRPDSSGPNYQACWREPEQKEAERA